MTTSQENLREEAEGCGFERRDNTLGFVGPVVQDLGYRFALKNINLVESYRQSDLYFVLKAATFDKGTEFDLVFNAVPRGIDEQLPNTTGSSYIPKLRSEVDAEKSVLICDSYPVESPEDIIPSLVRLERSKDRKQFLWSIFAPSAHVVLEFDRSASEGKVSMQRALVPTCGGRDSETRIVQRGSDLMDRLPSFIDQVLRNSVLESDPVDFVLRLIRVGIEKHLAWATLQERAHLSYEILDVQFCAD
jgi:hypothetical protein